MQTPACFGGCRGCLRIYFTTVDRHRDSEKKDRTKEIVRWLSEVRILCALNLRYTIESQSVSLLRRKERRGVSTYIPDGVF